MGRPRRRSTDTPELRRSRLTPMLFAAFTSATLAAALVVAGLALTNVGDDTTAIQKSREQSVRLSCQEQNKRHDQTVAALDAILAQRLHDASPQEARRLKSSRATTLLLINALAPRRDCARLTARLVAIER